ncbi:MAG: hypothetical protein LBL24_01195 [Bacteroidales bacterium]|jgi:hypothetical protein|nr:hypothetical protein [Bacteroidales bacterium]
MMNLLRRLADVFHIDFYGYECPDGQRSIVRKITVERLQIAGNLQLEVELFLPAAGRVQPSVELFSSAAGTVQPMVEPFSSTAGTVQPIVEPFSPAAGTEVLIL